MSSVMLVASFLTFVAALVPTSNESMAVLGALDAVFGLVMGGFPSAMRDSWRSLGYC